MSHTANRVRSTWLALGLALLLVTVACGFQQGQPTPTAVPSTPTPAPRPTAEPPAAAGVWYVAAQNEEPVRIWADLTASEIEALTRILARRYPQVKVEWRRGPDVELYQQTVVDARSGPPNWDVYVGDSGPLLRAARLALRWTPPEARTVPSELSDSEGAWYAIASSYHVVQYHTEQVPGPQVPRTYEGMLDPRFYGRLAIEDFNVTWLNGIVEQRGRDGAAELVKSLAQQAVTFRRDARTLVVFVTAGQHAIAIDARMDVVERERRAGGKTAWIAADPVITQPLGMVVSSTTDRPNAARLAANFLLSADAQTILAEAGRVPSRTDVDAEPQTLIQGLHSRQTLPPDGAAERDLRELWVKLWGRH